MWRRNLSLQLASLHVQVPVRAGDEGVVEQDVWGASAGGRRNVWQVADLLLLLLLLLLWLLGGRRWLRSILHLSLTTVDLLLYLLLVMLLVVLMLFGGDDCLFHWRVVSIHNCPLALLPLSATSLLFLHCGRRRLH